MTREVQMPQYKTVLSLALIIVLLAEFAAIMGIFTEGGDGAYEFTSLHKQKVMIYGRGVYKDMPAEMAPQGIAQDYVTLFLGIPLLLIALIGAQKGNARSRLLLGGVLLYFLVTYLFWLTMAAFNDLFLVYVVITSLSFFSFLLVLLHLPPRKVKATFVNPIPRGAAGIFLIVSAVLVASMWLSRLLPPLIRGTVPAELYHLTTMIVQGLDLALFLPIAMISGVLLYRKNHWGYLFAPIYLVFLAMLMTALLAKLAYMHIEGYPSPVGVYSLIGLLWAGSVYFSVTCLKGTR